jgi:aspartate/methionine/tyrosine aminotransferase
MKHAQTLQAFFDSPLAQSAEFNLSASAAEPVPHSELFALEPGAREALFEVSLDYPRRHGSAELEAAVASRYSALGDGAVQLSSGLDDALAMTHLALVQPGDRVVVLTPCYPPHLLLARWRGAQVVKWKARPENDWVPDLDELAALVAEPTRLVIATFPQNPTGFFPDADYRRRLIACLAAREVTLLSDEIYAGMPAVPGVQVPNLASAYPKAISLHGLSKTCGLPGLRIGWLASADREALRAIRAVANHFNCYLPAPADFLARLALRHEKALISRNTAIVEANQVHAEAFFARHANRFEWRAPDAGVLSFPRWLGDGGATALSDRLLEAARLTFAPSTCFEAGDGHLRLSLARRSLAAGLERLDAFLTGPG